MGSKCALQSRAPPTAAGPGLRSAGASAPHAGPCRPGGVGAQDCIPAGRRTSHPCQTSVPVLGGREWPGWRRGAQGPFVGGSTDDVTPTWDQSPWASALGSRPPSSPSSVPDLEPGESQPAAQGASARVTVCVCARHRLRALPSARRRRGPFWFTFWFPYFFAPLPSQPSLRSPPPLKSHKAVCNSIFSLLNFYLIHLEVLVEILCFSQLSQQNANGSKM